MNYFLDVLKKYVVFSGRAGRKEYWMYVLFCLIFSIAAGVIDTIIGSIIGKPVMFFSPLFSLGILLPSLAVAVRRLHDIGKSGLMILISFIPLVGSIWLLILLAKESVKEDNEYGPSTTVA